MTDEDDDLDYALQWELAGQLEGDDPLNRTVFVRAGDSDLAAGTTPFVASTDDEDRAGDIVRQDWRLANFRKNPVILDNHNHLRVVGRGERTVNRKLGPNDAGRERSQLEIDVAWDMTHPDPGIRGVGHQHLNKFRSAGSVGFRAGKRTMRNKLASDHYAFQEPIKIERPWGTYEVVGEYLENNELLEFSSATVPMNPAATQRHYLARLAEVAPDDVERRGAVVASTMPAETGAELLAKFAADPAAMVAWLWPDVVARAATDAEFFRAMCDAHPAVIVDLVRGNKDLHAVVRALSLRPADPPDNSIPFASLLARAMER